MDNPTQDAINRILACNGIIVGGFVLYLLGITKEYGDIDFFFRTSGDLNDALSEGYRKEFGFNFHLTYHDPAYRSFDLDIILCCFDKYGFHFDGKCLEAIQSRTISIIYENVIDLDGTMSRLQKYKRRVYEYN